MVVPSILLLSEQLSGKTAHSGNRLQNFFILYIGHRDSIRPAPRSEINHKVKDMTATKAPINYSVFAGGNHMYTWSFAYDIEAVRDWLFQQQKEDS